MSKQAKGTGGGPADPQWKQDLNALKHFIGTDLNGLTEISQEQYDELLKLYTKASDVYRQSVSQSELHTELTQIHETYFDEDKKTVMKAGEPSTSVGLETAFQEEEDRPPSPPPRKEQWEKDLVALKTYLDPDASPHDEMIRLYNALSKNYSEKQDVQTVLDQIKAAYPKMLEAEELAEAAEEPAEPAEGAARQASKGHIAKRNQCLQGFAVAGGAVLLAASIVGTGVWASNVLIGVALPNIAALASTLQTAFAADPILTSALGVMLIAGIVLLAIYSSQLCKTNTDIQVFKRTLSVAHQPTAEDGAKTDAEEENLERTTTAAADADADADADAEEPGQTELTTI